MTFLIVAGWTLAAVGTTAVLHSAISRPRWRWSGHEAPHLRLRRSLDLWLEVVSWRRRRGWRDEWERGFREGVEHLSRLLASGEGAISALEAVSEGRDPFCRQLRHAMSLVRAGSSLPDALAQWKGPAETDLLGRFRGILVAHHQTGADLTQPLRTLVEQCFRRQSLRQRVRGQTAEARLTARLLMILPPGVLVYFLLRQDDLSAWLFGSSTGRLVILYAAISWALGAWLIERQIDGVGMGASWRSSWRWLG